MDGSQDRNDLGALGALSEIDGAQRDALDAAMRIAGELAAAGSHLAEVPILGGRAGGDPAAGGRAPFDTGRMRTNVVQAAETLSDLLRSVMDMGFDAMDELARRPRPRTSIRVRSGHPATMLCAVRNDTGHSAARAVPILGPLVDHEQRSLRLDVTCRPAVLHLEPYARADVEVDLVIAADTEPGEYHGVLLLSGVPTFSESVTVVVQAPDA